VVAGGVAGAAIQALDAVRPVGNDQLRGEQQMLALARALISSPRLLLIEEPTQNWRRTW
jgi:ABC-type branched-subunit amino acid transport system ATPase component